MSPRIVPIELVMDLKDSSSPWAVRKMRAVLEKQGQIEPLQVRRSGERFQPWSQDPWANEIIYAARELGWSTLLVVETRRYEE